MKILMYLLITLEMGMIYFLLLIKDNNNTLKLPNKNVKICNYI